jgi:preprotein translocase SecE subunit
MALVTQGNEGKAPMADDKRPNRKDDEREDRDEAADRSEAVESEGRVAAASVGRGVMFAVYKPGQGKWTRLGTAGGSLLLVVLLAQFLYTTLAVQTKLDPVVGAFPVWKLSIVGGLTLVSLFLLWRYENKPEAVDFLIATESEMKKVNWTSRKDLFGSTKVVIAFMLLIAAILFVIDVVFGYFFWLINVLKTGPFA